MPRSLRLQYAGAIYHVMSRGNRRQRIVRDDRDRERFLDSLAEACAKNGLAGARLVSDGQSLSWSDRNART